MSPILVEEEVASPSRASLARQFSSWKVLILAGVIFIAVAVFLGAKVTYDRSNYSTAFASAAQLLGVSLAVLISVSLFASQIVEGVSSLAMRFLPRAGVLGILVFEAGVVVLDLFILLILPAVANSLQLLAINIGFVSNLLAVVAVIPYWSIISRWIRVDSLVEDLVAASKKDKRSESRLEIIQSLEELAFRSAERRQAHTCSRIIEGCEDLSDILASSGERDIEAIKKNPNHPIRKLQDAIGRIGEFCSDFKVEDAIPQIAWTYRYVTGVYDKAGLASTLDVELSGSMEQIIGTCAENKQEWTIYNFWANMTYVMEEWIRNKITERSRILLFTFSAMEKSLIHCVRNNLREAVYQIVESIEGIAHSYQGCGYPMQTVHGSRVVQLESKEDLISLIARAEEWCKLPSVKEFVGRYGDRTISEILLSARKVAQKLPNVDGA